MAKRKKTEKVRDAYGHVVRRKLYAAKATPTEPVVKRVPVDFDYNCLNPYFIKGLGRIGQYAAGKYGSWDQYLKARLVGEKSPINHALEHIFAYMRGEKHDRFGDMEMQLVAAAYNLMIEVGYLHKFGFVPHPLGANVGSDPFVRTKHGQIIKRKSKR